jgi:cytochrome c oxidase subunit 3
MINKTKSRILRMNPNIFLVWIFMISISMIFVSLVSAYIVKKGEPGGFNVELPLMFYYSSFIVVLSSVFKQLAYYSAKKDNFKSLKIYLLLSFIGGLSFLFIQYLGWVNLVDGGVYFVGHPDGSFIYILSGVHAILVVYVFSIKFKIHSKNLNLIEMSTTYWHFLTFLWVYLFITLYFYNI